MAIRSTRERWVFCIAAVPMAVLALSCIYPVFFTINNTMKNTKGNILNRFGLVDAPSLQNFYDAWGRAHLSQYLLNSVVVTAGAVALLLLISSMAGFALAMLRFPYRRALFIVILASLMIPVQVVLVPFYRTMLALDLVNTRIGLIIALLRSMPARQGNWSRRRGWMGPRCGRSGRTSCCRWGGPRC